MIFASTVRVATLRDAPLRYAPQGEGGARRERVLADGRINSQALRVRVVRGASVFWLMVE